MRVHVESVWACDPDYVWDKVQQSATLTYVMRPLISIRPVGMAAFPPRWSGKTTIPCKLYLLSFLPLGIRQLAFEKIDDSQREIQTRETDPIVRRWDHLIRVAPAGLGRTRYSDTIEIEAGLLTGLVSLFAHFFYRHRQRRWRAIAEQSPEI